ncbi:hypothetical protein N9Y67_00160 [Pseudomonadota bacterium]|nr:hypothetical protein [Pseudomonadota bacterium]
MGDLTPNLSRREFKCTGVNCHRSGKGNCGSDTIDFDLVNYLQATVNHFKLKYGRDVRIDITGPNRCKTHNDALREKYKRTGGKFGAKTAKGSQHALFRAADFKLFFRDENKQISPREVFDYLDKKYGNKVALGLYVNRCHIDTRTYSGKPIRWEV